MAKLQPSSPLSRQRPTPRLRSLSTGLGAIVNTVAYFDQQRAQMDRSGTSRFVHGPAFCLLGVGPYEDWTPLEVSKRGHYEAECTHFFSPPMCDGTKEIIEFLILCRRKRILASQCPTSGWML